MDNENTFIKRFASIFFNGLGRRLSSLAGMALAGVIVIPCYFDNRIGEDAMGLGLMAGAAFGYGAFYLAKRKFKQSRSN